MVFDDPYGRLVAVLKLHVDKVINIDQSPIGRTPRSNPATYVGLFTFIRDLFSNLEEKNYLFEVTALGYLDFNGDFDVLGATMGEVVLSPE